MSTYATVKAIVIAHTRSGGTWLNHCLSSHPQIFWPRGEPFHPGMEYYRAFPDARQNQILTLIHRACHYHAAGCKITYKQVWPGLSEYIRQNDVRIIHLMRENLLRVIVSQIITGRVEAQLTADRKAHSFQEAKAYPPKLPRLGPGDIIRRMTELAQAIEKQREWIAKTGADALYLTYTDIVGEAGEANLFMPRGISHILCNFLDVEERILTGRLRRVNPYRLQDMIPNWDELKQAILATEFSRSQFAGFLEEGE